MQFGMDYLGLGSKSWDLDMTIKETPEGWAIGCFDGTTGDAKFGDAAPAIRKLLKSGKFPLVRVQMWYASNHCTVPIDVLQKRLPVWEKVAKEFPNVKFYLSHSCEHNEKSASELKKRIDLIRKLAPSCTPVNTKWQGLSADSPSVMEETHGTRLNPPYFFSYDGRSANNTDVTTELRGKAKCDVFFFWASRFNLREEGESVPTPDKRTAAPDAKYIRAIVALSKPKGAAPVPQFKGKVFPVMKPILWKTFAEDKIGVDVRANKPLLISPSTSEILTVVACNGKEVAKLKMFGGYPPNLHRHYSGTGSNLYGYEMAKRALKLSGSEYVWIKDGSTYYGPIHPAFRQGYF